MIATSRANNLLGLSRGMVGRQLTRHEQAKFLLTASAPALIQPEEADRLIDYVVDESQLFNMATVERMTTNEKDIRFIDITGGVLRQAVCGATCAESVDISNTNKCLRTVSLDAKFYLCDDDLEDGITGAALESQVMRMAADQIANELEIIALMWNTNGSYTNPAMVNNNVMGLRDGWYRQLMFGNPIDAGSVDAGDRTLTFHKLNCLLRALPTKYRRNPAALRIFMPSDMWFDYAELHQGRATSLGDRAHLGPLETRHLTTPIEPVALMPTDIQNCGCGGSLPEANGAFMFVTEPSNLVVGIERAITFEREREACEHRTWFIWTIRFDALVFNEDATATMDCMTLEPCLAGTCAPSALLSKCNACIDTGSGGEP